MHRTSTYIPPGYGDDFLSKFDRTPRLRSRLQSQTTAAKNQTLVSSESLLKKTSSITITHGGTKRDLWNCGFARQIPYASLFALSTVLFCGAADAVILWKSDGKDVESWTISPSVLLSILSAVAKVSLHFSRSKGVVTAWWRKALAGGKLKDLDRYWKSGDSIVAAGISGRRFNVVALATLVVSVVVFDGPLLQRASTIGSRQVVKTVNVTAPIAQEIPYGYTALANIDGAEQLTVMKQTFAQIVNAYARRDPIITDFRGCVGNCSGTVKVAGLAINCSISSVEWNNALNVSANVGSANVF